MAKSFFYVLFKKKEEQKPQYVEHIVEMAYNSYLVMKNYHYLEKKFYKTVLSVFYLKKLKIYLN